MVTLVKNTASNKVHNGSGTLDMPGEDIAKDG